MTIVETERVHLRNWQEPDIPVFGEIARDPRVMKYIGTGAGWDQERVLKFVASGMEAAKTRGWVLWPVIYKENGELIGMCGFNGGFAPDVEIGWWLKPEYWARGIATEIARATMAYGFETWGFDRLISVAQPGNTASIRVMEKLGMAFDRAFTHNGIDVVAYAIARPSTR
jgi:RimJ/RimL family protein N-acetyltransferase